MKPDNHGCRCGGCTHSVCENNHGIAQHSRDPIPPEESKQGYGGPIAAVQTELARELSTMHDEADLRYAG